MTSDEMASQRSGSDTETTPLEAAVAAMISRDEPLDFEQVALAVFLHQFERNLPYRKYCLRRARTPQTVNHWREIPAVSTAAFRIVDLTCGAAERVFLTSGTTRGQASRGRHLIPCLDLYRVAALGHFSACVAPDGMHAPVMALTPPPALRPQSSLVQMIEWISEAYGTDEDAYFVGPHGLETEALCARLHDESQAGRPVYLIGLTAAFENLFACCTATKQRFRLAYGTRLIDTGGDKRSVHETGSGRPFSRRGFLNACWRLLNVPGYHCINEYGMTELCSQFYDNVLRERFAGRITPRYKVGPKWTRTIIVDPETLEEVPPGTPGLLRHFDLANCGSIMAVQTEDIGVAVADGFELRGRIRGAEPRGCALLLEEVTKANADTVALPPRNH